MVVPNDERSRHGRRHTGISTKLFGVVDHPRHSETGGATSKVIHSDTRGNAMGWCTTEGTDNEAFQKEE